MDEKTEQLDLIPQHVREVVASMRDRAEHIVEGRMESLAWQELNACDMLLAELPQVEFKLNHIFTPGLCTREIFMSKGSLLTSRIHLFEHPFVISLGRVAVWSDEHGWEIFGAPFTGVTKPGTRRLLYVLEDTIWSTFHVTTKTTPAEVIAEVTYDHMKLGHLAEIPADRQPLKEVA